MSGDAEELLTYNLPQPHYFNRHNTQYYAIAWVIDGFFHTKQGIEYLNDIIARIALTMPVNERLNYKPIKHDDIMPYKLEAFQNAVSLRTNYVQQAIKHSNEASRDMIFWAIKFQAESLIRQFNGWFDYQLLEAWALNLFADQAKDASTLRAKCRGVWHWYDKRDFTIPTGQRGFTMSRAETGINAAAKNAAATKAKVVGAVAALKHLEKKINIVNTAKQAGVSLNTAKKYLKELEII